MKKRRTADGADLLVVVDADSSVPMHRQVYEGLRGAIVEGRIAAGARLPSTRALAAELSVARNTVTAAFEQLRAEGYVSARSGGGTRVKDVLPDRLLRLPQRSARRAATSADGGGGRAPVTGGEGTSGAAAAVDRRAAGELSRRGERLVEAARWFPAVAQGGEAFRVGTPALDDFPVALWGRLVSHRWRRPPPLGMSDAAGYEPLRRAVAAYVSAARGVRCDWRQVVIVNGSQHGLHLAARLLLDAGDEAWCPCPWTTRACAWTRDAPARRARGWRT